MRRNEIIFQETRTLTLVFNNRKIDTQAGDLSSGYVSLKIKRQFVIFRCFSAEPQKGEHLYRKVKVKKTRQNEYG